MDKTAVMISIRPEWCKLIVEGKKTVEARKTFPERVRMPFKCYIYESQKSKSVIGEFTCDSVYALLLVSDSFAMREKYYATAIAAARLTDEQLKGYSGGKNVYGWRISDLLIYDQPLSIGEFSVLRGTTNWTWVEKLKRPPQSWCYVFEKEVAANDKA